jgi:hypothetical protein
VFPKAAAQKQEIERVYLLRLANITCRYFAASLRPREQLRRDSQGQIGPHGRSNSGPWCPFGNDCHYRHEKEPGVKYVFSDAELSRAMWGQRAAARRRRNASGRYQHGPRARLDYFLGAGGMSEWVMQFVHGAQGRRVQNPEDDNDDDDDDDDDEDIEDISEDDDDDLDYDIDQDDHGFLGNIDPFTAEYIIDEEYEFRVQVLDQILTETLLPW